MSKETAMAIEAEVEATAEVTAEPTPETGAMELTPEQMMQMQRPSQEELQMFANMTQQNGARILELMRCYIEDSIGTLYNPPMNAVMQTFALQRTNAFWMPPRPNTVELLGLLLANGAIDPNQNLPIGVYQTQRLIEALAIVVNGQAGNTEATYKAIVDSKLRVMYSEDHTYIDYISFKKQDGDRLRTATVDLGANEIDNACYVDLFAEMGIDVTPLEQAIAEATPSNDAEPEEGEENKQSEPEDDCKPAAAAEVETEAEQQA